MLTESIVENSRDGSQTVRITDPVSRRRVTIPSVPRGYFKPKAVAKFDYDYTEEEWDPTVPPPDVTNSEASVDLRHSSRN